MNRIDRFVVGSCLATAIVLAIYGLIKAAEWLIGRF